MPKLESRLLNEDEAREEAFELQQNLEKNQNPSEDGAFSKEQYQEESEKLESEKEATAEIKLTPEQKQAKFRLIDTLKRHTANYEIVKVIKKANLPLDIINSPEVQQIVLDSMISCLNNGGYYNVAIDIIETFNFSSDIINSHEVQEAVKNCFNYLLDKQRFNNALEIVEKFNLLQNFVQQNTKETIIKKLANNHIDEALKIAEKFEVSPDIINSSEVQQATEKRVMDNLINEYPLSDIIRKFNLSQDFIGSPEVQQIAREKTIDNLKRAGVYSTKIVEEFNLPLEFINSEEVQNLAKSSFEKQMYEVTIDGALEIVEKFNLPQDFVRQTVEKVLVKYLLSSDPSNKGIYIALGIVEKFNLSSESIQQAAMKAFIDNLNIIEFGISFKIAEKFNLSQNFVQQIVKQKIIKYLESPTIHSDEASKIAKMFNIPQDDLQQEISDAIINRVFNYGNKNESSKAEEALKIIKNFDLPKENIQQIGKSSIINFLAKGLSDKAYEVIEKFDVPSEVIQQATEEGLKEYLKYSNDEWLNQLDEIIKEFNISPDIIRKAAEEASIERLKDNNLQKFSYIVQKFSLSSEFLNSQEAQKIAQEKMIEYLQNDREGAIELFKIFDFPSEFINSNEVQKFSNEAMVGYLSNDDFYNANEIARGFNFSEEIIQQNSIDGMILAFSGGNIRHAVKISKQFDLPEDIVQKTAKEGVSRCLVNGYAYKAIDVVKEFNFSEETIKEIIQETNIEKSYSFCLQCNTDNDFKNEMWQKLSQEIKNDEFINEKFSLANSLWGEKQWENVIKENGDFWVNAHNNLLFFEKIIILPAETQKELFNVVLQPFINRSFSDFSRLNEHLGYFDIDKYKNESAGKLIPFVNFEAFVREAEIQRWNIDIPPNASDEFKETIRHFIPIRGIDVPFLREMIDNYEQRFLNKEESESVENNNNEEDNYDDEEIDGDYYERAGSINFSNRLIDIIEGLEPINENKEIRPWSETFSLDPVYRLVFTTVGVHSLNNLTVKMQEYCNKGGVLTGITEILASENEKIIEQIEKEYAEKIKAEPEKKNKLKAECGRQIKKNQLLIYGASEKVIGISDFNEPTWQMALNNDVEKLNKGLVASLETPGLKELIFSSLTDLSKKSEIINSCVDLIPFCNALLETSNRLIEKFDAEKFKNTPTAEIMEFFSGKETTLSAYLLYLGINNQKRQTESKKFKTLIDQVINQEKYKKQLQQLKAKGFLEQKADVFTAYTQGKIILDEIDDDKVMQTLKQYGYADVGRNLKAEIAEGNDYTAWTCGDETDCCMPFTSHKNQEYLLRNDTAYFVVKTVNQFGNEEIIAQSVLVNAQNPGDDKETVIGIDNIEIANNAINLRPVIKEAYDKLKNELVSRFPGKQLRLIIGTSYNDDGGTITGDLTLMPVKAEPRQGELSYSDCFSHSSAYEFYNSTENIATIKYFGLAKDLLERSKIYDLVKDKQEMEKIEKLMEKIGQGEDDGDGGLNFPDNYSAVIVDVKAGNQTVGYIVAADYLSDDENDEDYVCVEKVGWQKDITSEQAKKYFKSYLENRDLLTGKSHEYLDGIKISQEFAISQPQIVNWLEEFYGKDKITKLSEGGVVISWT